MENVEEGFQEGREAAEHLESGLLVTEVLVALGWDKAAIMKHQDGGILIWLGQFSTELNSPANTWTDSNWTGFYCSDNDCTDND